MKNSKFLWVVLFLLLPAVMVLAEVWNVQMKESALRESPDNLAKVVGKVHQGDALTKLEGTKTWMKVQTSSGNVGWIPVSSLTKDAVIIKAGGKDASGGASDAEMANATKGFTKEIETKYRDGNKNVNFGPVDRMEKFKVTEDEIRAFIREGKLGKGDAK